MAPSTNNPSGPKGPTSPGQRSLAAIVFTDVVSFSARMQTDEEATLTLLRRDFDTMHEICSQHQGSVLKTTGDGLLLYFSSAVQAVACALAMQRFFAEQAKTRPAAESLVHRLGIHLGDVFVNDQDVMGDGVNIAARLQAEAEPGGICISQTVYDVVKNKLVLHVTRMGPRELKNISQRIPIYRLLLEASVLEAQAGESQPPEPAADKPPARAQSRAWKIALAASLGAALLLFIVLAVLARVREKREEARVEATQNAIAATVAEDTPDAGNRERIASTISAWRAELRDQRSTAAEEYNFAELARSARDPRSPLAGKPEVQIRQMVLARMQGLFNWLATALQHYGRENPLVVHELSGTAPKEIRVFVGADRRLYYTEGGATRQRNWTELQPAVLGAIIVGALHDAPTPPSREVVQGALAFAGFYHLPELQEALRKGRSRHPGK